MGTITIYGKYASATIFTANIHSMEDYCRTQLQMLCDNEISENARIRVMPDVHPGKVCTIGLTMTVGDKIMPNVVGIDIGCGISLAHVKGKVNEFQKLDTVIRDRVPSGFNVRNNGHRYISGFDFGRLHCRRNINMEKALVSAGSLGAGNHFIELDQDIDHNTYLVIHSGSRHLGKEVTEYYLSEGQKMLKAKNINLPYELTYLENDLKESYIHDLLIVQEYARISRDIMIAEICKGMKWKILNTFTCIHNYVDTSKQVIEQFGAPILRKGAISAQKDEKTIIPINMRDGIILGTGLGNTEWNCSAPHGSGRIMKREDIKSHFTLSSFKSCMKGIYSSCISRETLDEAPFAYRSIEEIQDAVVDTVKIDQVIHPIYNYKSGS